MTRGAQLSAKAAAKSGSKGRPKPGGTAKSPKRTALTPVEPVEAVAAASSFRLGVVPGATPGKWIDAWRERMPETALELAPIDARTSHQPLRDGMVDAALVRLPIESAGLSVIPLYDEVAVVVMSVDSALTVADELQFADLAGEIVITPRDDVYGLAVPDAVTPAFDAPADTAEAIATVAAGVGIVIVPMSIARLHRRKDVTRRPLRGAPASTIALAWTSEHTTPEVETFVGIVRGRTANSSR